MDTATTLCPQPKGKEGNMSMKLKVLGLGLLAMMATGAFAVMNAGATNSGHFVTGSEHTFITGIQGAAGSKEHELHFISESGATKIGCDNSLYTGTHKGTKTTTELTITPSWSNCYTTGSNEAKWDVHENGCTLVFTSRATPASNDATVDVKCPPSKAIEITHPNCLITVDPQTVGGAKENGVTYTNQGVSPEKWITMDIKVSLATTYHGGVCVFLGTPHTSTMEGSVTVTGFSNSLHTVRTDIGAA